MKVREDVCRSDNQHVLCTDDNEWLSQSQSSYKIKSFSLLGMIEISFQPAMPKEEIALLTKIVNAVYNVGEGDLFQGGLTRTNENELAQMMKNEEILVARDESGKIVGSIYVIKKSDDLAKLGKYIHIHIHRCTYVLTHALTHKYIHL